MAKRPIFVPLFSHYPFVNEILIGFNWFPGFALLQAQKSISSLHAGAKEKGINPILEISTKSEEPLGVALSAFNLIITHGEKKLSVESAFQGSKIFQFGGPFTDLYLATGFEAKKDKRIKESGDLTGFSFFCTRFPTKPLTIFYDWLYIKALSQNTQLSSGLFDYCGFSDIAFNPERSFNCQARSAALFVALSNSPEIQMEKMVSDVDYYLNVLGRSISLSAKKTKEGDDQPSFNF